jgi:hypothetical protein
VEPPEIFSFFHESFPMRCKKVAASKITGRTSLKCVKWLVNPMVITLNNFNNNKFYVFKNSCNFLLAITVLFPAKLSANTLLKGFERVVCALLKCLHAATVSEMYMS